jgi:Cu/Ag efflux protein CusF
MAWLPVLTLVVLLAGCGGDAGQAPAEPAPAEDEAPAAVKTYTLRGEVTGMPEGEDSRIRVHHEAIPDFEMHGEVVGMDAMTMAFQPAEGISLDGIEIGTKVTFDWAISDAVPSGEIVRVEILPDDAVLNFDAPSVDGAEGDEAADHGGHEH